jgi:hypothetical protein
MEYEQTVGGKSSMEGTSDQQAQQPYLPPWKRKKMNGAKLKDNTVDVNDPCCPNADGYGEYRNREQIERQSKEVAELQKQQHDHAAKQVITAMSAQHLSYTMQLPTWYYRDNTSGAIQGPFSGEQMMGWRDFFPLFTPVRFGHSASDLFMFLSEIDFMNPPVTPVPPPPPLLENNIAAVPYEPVSYDGDERGQCGLKSKPEESQNEGDFISDIDGNPQPEVEICLPPPSDDEDDNTNDDDDEDNNSNGDRINPEVDLCIPPPSDDETDDENHDYDNTGDRINEEENQFETPYPAVEESTFPIDEVVPYPVDVEYPFDEGYEYPDTGGAHASGEMSAVAPYPIADDVVFGVTDYLDGRMDDYGVTPLTEVKKKEYKGDKEVVGFVPSHLRVKRKNGTKKTSATSKPKTFQPTQAPAGYSVAEDYEKFMDEISELT